MRLSRRRFVTLLVGLAGGWSVHAARPEPVDARRVSLLLAGDVMLGRGIDQIMRQSADPRLYEPYLTDARQYIELAEAVNGRIPRGVDPGYVWGDALEELAALAPDVRIVNLENAVSARGTPWSGKGIHYRMHPGNVATLQAARVDCCVLANNHALDWGIVGLDDTLRALHVAGIHVAGAGYDASSAQHAAVVPVGAQARVSIVGLASVTSGVPPAWRAAVGRPGLNMPADSVDRTVQAVLAGLGDEAPRDLVVVSIHWGGNWGYAVPAWQRRLAHALIDTGRVDVVHGHSAHHAKGIEVYRDRLVLYGCGDLINDYEGISGHEAFRGDLRLLYMPLLDAESGRLLELTLTPMRAARFRLQRTTPNETRWLLDMLNREGEQFGTRFVLNAQHRLVLAGVNKSQQGHRLPLSAPPSR